MTTIRFSPIIFGLCILFFVVRVETSIFGDAKDKSTATFLAEQAHSLEQADHSVRAGSPSNVEIKDEQLNLEETARASQKAESAAIPQVKRTKPQDSLLLAAAQYFQFDDNDKKNDETDEATLGSLRRDPLTTLISTVFVGCTILVWLWYPRSRHSSPAKNSLDLNEDAPDAANSRTDSSKFKAIDDLNCVLVTPEDKAVAPCRPAHVRRPQLITHGALVRSVVLLAFDKKRRLLLNADGKASATGTVRFSEDELHSSSAAAIRVGREADLLDEGTVLRPVGRFHFLSSDKSRHEIAHVFALTLSDAAAARATGDFVTSVPSDSDDELLCAIASTFPVFDHWTDASFSSTDLRQLTPADSLPPAVRTGCVTKKGGPKNRYFPALTKLHQYACMVKIKMSIKKRKFEDPDEDFCFDILRKVSRSFAIVIEGLPEELRTPVCVYYLILRALDTVEDDVNISREEKERHLKLFVTYLESVESIPAEIRAYGDGGYLELMAKFDAVVRVYLKQRPEYRRTIAMTTSRMADGMLLYLDAQNNVQKHAEYNEYCFFVAGLVGLGLTDLFADSGLEPDLVPEPFCGYHVQAPVESTVHSSYSGTNGPRASSCAMALMLQKTNILRDYKEDIDDARLWWPAEVFRCYTSSPATFQTPEGEHAGLACLNQLIVDALHHIPGCLDYLSRIKDPRVFSFCAVPQAMAIATLTTCFNNPDVFHKNVKIGRGEACASMVACKNIHTFCAWAKTYIDELILKTEVDPVLFANVRSSLHIASNCLSRMETKN